MNHGLFTANATGTLFSNGYVTGGLEGFEGSLVGEICPAGKPGNLDLGGDDD